MSKTLPPMPVLESMGVHREWRHVISSAMPAMFSPVVRGEAGVFSAVQSEAGEDARGPLAAEPVFSPAAQESPRIIQPQLLEAAFVKSRNERQVAEVTRVATPRVTRFSQSGYRPLHLRYQPHPASANSPRKSTRREHFPLAVVAGAAGLCLLLMAISLYFLTN